MIKECVECNEKFFIELKKGSGGTSCLNRKYCSEACKRKWKAKHGKNNLIQTICVMCKKELFLFPSLIKEKNYCSRKCQNISLNGIQKISQKTCLVCSSPFDFIETTIRGKEQKYCSHICASKRIIKKTGAMIECHNCKKFFYSKNSLSFKRKYCSDPCQFEAQSKGIKHIPTNGRTGFRKDLPLDQYFKSSFEADYARYLIKNKIIYYYEKHTFRTIIDGKEKFYTPDFYIPAQDKYIELKGAKNKEKYNKNILSALYLREQGKNIDVIYMKDFYDGLKKDGIYETMFLEAKNYKKSINIILEK
jgi:hypothetical protein